MKPTASYPLFNEAPPDVHAFDGVLNPTELSLVTTLAFSTCAPLANKQSVRPLNATLFKKSETGGKLISLCRKIIATHYPGSRGHHFRSAQLNLCYHDDVTSLHQDFNHCRQCISFVLFLNPFWEKKLKGELAFYSSPKSKPELLVPQLPGRLISFHGIRHHGAMAPAKHYTKARATLGLWFFCEKEFQQQKKRSLATQVKLLRKQLLQAR